MQKEEVVISSNSSNRVKKIGIKRFLPLVLVVLVTAVSYGNIFRNQFIGDDYDFIVRWSATRNFNYLPALLQGLTPPGQEGTYRPVRSVLYLLAYQIWGTNESGYHLFSLTVHLLITGLIYFLVRNVIYLQGKTTKTYRLLPFLSALLFGLHPVHSEAVTFMTAGFDTAAFVWLFLSLNLFVLWLRNTGNRKLRLWSLATGLLAIGTNEICLVLPFLIALVDMIFSPARPAKWKAWLPYAGVVAGYFFIRMVLLQITSRGTYLAGSFWLTLITSIKAIYEYFWLLIFPRNLSLTHYLSGGISTYTFPELNLNAVRNQSVLDFPVLVVVLVLFGTIYMVTRLNRKKHGLWLFAAGWFWICLLPLVNLFPSATIMSERYIYLASAGFCVLLALALIRISQFTGRILPDKLQQPLLVIWILVVVTGYGMKTFTRNKDWRSEIVFWQKTSQIDPKNGVVWYQLGKAYQNQSQVQPAIDAYTQAVTLIPKFTNAYELLGNVYQSRFEYDKALESYESAMKINPNLPETINNVARVYFDLAKLQIGKNDYSSVKELLTDALKMNPDYADAAHLYEELCREKRIECL